MTNEIPILVNKCSGSLIRRYLAVSLTAFLIVSSLSFSVNAADGDLDATFGSGGKVTTDFFNSFDGASAIAIQKDGKIIAAGGATRIINANFTFEFALVRFNVDGSPDQTFGSGGKVTTEFLNGSASGRALAIQNDGKIIVAGNLGNSDFALARYNSDGSLDTTFGSAGKVTTDFGAVDTVSAVALQTDGKIVVAGGIQYNGTDSDFALARYNVDGSLDLTFGSGGKVITAFSNRHDFAADVVLQNDGKIIAVGGAGDSAALALARYANDGSLDSTFGSGGRVVIDVSNFSEAANAVALQADGKIIITGFAINAGTSYDFILVRCNTDGSVDTSFGSGGNTVTDFFNGDDLATDLVLQSDGAIIISGNVKTSTSFDATYDFGLARYKSDGSLDTTFGSGGKVITDFFNLNDRSTRMAMQDDGRIVVVGFASKNDSDSDFALARYNNVVFDICIQDDSNGSNLKLNSSSGDYRFTTCLGQTLEGRGTIMKKGGIVTLQHYGSGRRVLAKIDMAVGRGSATIQILGQGRTFTILDRNTFNSICACTAR